MDEKEKRIEDGYRKLAQQLIYLTIWDAYQLSIIKPGTRTTNPTKRYKLGLGYQGHATKERIKQMRQDLDEWIGSDNFFVIARKLGYDPDWLKTEIRNIASGMPATEEWKKLVQESSSYYAQPRGRKTKAITQEDHGTTA
jgi:hypothetical protein